MKRLIAFILLLPALVFAAAPVVITVIGPPAPQVTVQPTSTVVTPTSVTVNANVSVTSTGTVTIAVPGPQGIPGATTAGEGGGVDPLHFAGYSTNRQAEIMERAKLRDNAVFNTVSGAKFKSGNWELTSTGLKYPNPPYAGTSLERTILTVENNNIRTQLLSSGQLTSNSRLQFKDQNTGYIYWDSVVTDVQTALVQSAVKSDWTAAGTIAEILNKPAFTRGYDGREIELQKSATHIQWRFVGDITWTNLVLLSAITGPAGIDGIIGVDGKNYSCAITGGIRSILYDKNGSNPSPTMVAFGVELRENGSVVTPASYAWSVPASGSLLSGSASSATFTPTVNSTFSAGSADNRVDAALTYAGITCRATAPVPVTRVGADGVAGSDSKQQIYTKVGVGSDGDVLNTTSGAGDADGFAFRTVRVNGNIHRSDLVPGKTVIYSQPADTASTIKLQINKAGSTAPALTVSAGGTVTVY